MQYFAPALEKLVEQYARLPGVGTKSAQRLAFHVLGLPESEAQEFADAILDAKRSVTCCPVCQNFTAGGLCPICASPRRDGSTICVVADPRDVVAIERSREYNGHYHVLHGVISPMNHVGPDDLSIKSLLFTNNRKVITREAKSQCINRGKIFQIKLSNITADNTVRFIRTNIVSICITGITIIVICPGVGNSIILTLNFGIGCTIRQSARTAEKLT